MCCDQRLCPMWRSAQPCQVNSHKANGDFSLTPPGGHHHQKQVKHKSCRQRKVQGRKNKSVHYLFIQRTRFGFDVASQTLQSFALNQTRRSQDEKAFEDSRVQSEAMGQVRHLSFLF